MHTRLDVAVGATVWYWMELHSVNVWHMRSLVGVAATDWYRVAPHTVSAVHVRSLDASRELQTNVRVGSLSTSQSLRAHLVNVGSADAYCALLHSLTDAQTRSDVGVREEDSNVTPNEHAVM